MTGRGIDQIMAYPSDPAIHERDLTSADDYVRLAERYSGPVPRAVAPSYIWGDALAEIENQLLDARIINLETSVTTNDQAELKGINYRMHPDNIPCLIAAGINCCVLANNHVLDWGIPGLVETLEVLRSAGIATAGAGVSAHDAEEPAIITPEAGRLLVFGIGFTTSGIPASWNATGESPGVRLLEEPSTVAADSVIEQVERFRLRHDVVVVSLHWGPNWGYGIGEPERRFAHRLLDSGAVDLVHGHSSHHVKGMELYRGKLILYGCGDFITDYEGIGGCEAYRPDLAVAYFVTLDDALRAPQCAGDGALPFTPIPAGACFACGYVVAERAAGSREHPLRRHRRGLRRWPPLSRSRSRRARTTLSNKEHSDDKRRTRAARKNPCRSGGPEPHTR
jgi:poly-gamma-glutamate capsule biosynthesis protein CapA/YwtB (metallophosphatase superfamily)